MSTSHCMRSSGRFFFLSIGIYYIVWMIFRLNAAPNQTLQNQKRRKTMPVFETSPFNILFYMCTDEFQSAFFQWEYLTGRNERKGDFFEDIERKNNICYDSDDKHKYQNKFMCLVENIEKPVA